MLRWAQSARMVTKHNHHRTSIGSTMVFRTSVARAAGGFDVRMGPGAGGWLGSCEDADLLLRIIAAGSSVWYDPDLAVYHRDSRRDGGAEAESKALAYGCGQGHMWRTHGFSRGLVALLLLRRFAGSLVWVLRGRSDIGRAHRAWGRGALNGLLGRPPADFPASDHDGPDAPPDEGTDAPPPDLRRLVGLSALGAGLVIAATVAVTAIAARRWGPSGVEVACALIALAMVGAMAGRGWWIGRLVEPARHRGEDRRGPRPTIVGIETAVAVTLVGAVWLAAWLLDGEAAARQALSGLLAAQVVLPAMLATTMAASDLAPLMRGRTIGGARRMVRAVVGPTRVVAALLAVLAVVAAPDLLRVTHGPDLTPSSSSLAVSLLAATVATALGAATVVLVLADRHRPTAAVAIGWLAIAGPGVALAAWLGGSTGLVVAAASSIAGLTLLVSSAAWVTTGISVGPPTSMLVRRSPAPQRRRSRSTAGPSPVPAGQQPIGLGPPRSPDDPDLSLIVSTVGRPTEFRRMVASIAREAGEGIGIELVVVDQSGSDETRRILEESALQFPWRHVRSERGLSLGRNTGLSHARGRYVTFPDDDVWYSGAMLAPAVSRLDRTPDLAGVCARLATEDGSDSMLRWARTPKAVTPRNHHRTSIGPVMVIRREVACRIGGFDETLGPGTGLWYGSCDDADFVLRVVEDGGTVWYDPDLHLHHRDPRLDGDPDTQRKSLAYGCGQGRMWRTHRFGRPWIAFLLARRLVGSVIMDLRRRRGVGRAQRAWVRGALAGLIDYEPVELRPVPPEPVAPSAPQGDGVERRPTADEFVRGFQFRIAMAVIGMAATFALTAIASRLLPDAELTRFYALLAALAILPVLSRFGLNTKAVQDLGAARGRGEWATALRLADQYVRACLVPSLLTGPFVAVVFVAWSSGSSFVPYAVLASLILVTESIRLTHSDVLVGLGLPGWGAALAHHVRAVAVVVVVAVDLAVFGSSMDLVRLLTIQAVVGVVLAGAGQIKLSLLSGRAGARPLKLDIGSMARAGAPFAVTDLAYTVIASGDIWLAAKAFEPSTAALYSTASVLAKQIVAPIGLASIALGPVAAGYLAQRRTADLERIVRAVLSGLGLLLLPGLIALAVFGDRVLGVAYGDRFESAHLPFALLLFGYGAVICFGLSRTILLMAGGERLAMGLSLGWMTLIVPLGVAAAVVGGPVHLAVASAGGTAGLVVLQAAGAWVTTGIRAFPSGQAARDLLLRWDRLVQLARGARRPAARSG
jgi:O-antigen/teichoic acid export membrane protein/glycosyltransferase involved in cell wall biosynthesis